MKRKMWKDQSKKIRTTEHKGVEETAKVTMVEEGHDGPRFGIMETEDQTPT